MWVVWAQTCTWLASCISRPLSAPPIILCCPAVSWCLLHVLDTVRGAWAILPAMDMTSWMSCTTWATFVGGRFNLVLLCAQGVVLLIASRFHLLCDSQSLQEQINLLEVWLTRRNIVMVTSMTPLLFGAVHYFVRQMTERQEHIWSDIIWYSTAPCWPLVLALEHLKLG